MTRKSKRTVDVLPPLRNAVAIEVDPPPAEEEEEEDDTSPLTPAAPATTTRRRRAKVKVDAVVAFQNPEALEADSSRDPFLDLSKCRDPISQALLYYFYSLSESTDPNTVASFDRIEKLLEAGAHINARDRAGASLLHEVARDWGADIALFLIYKGADVKITDERGRTALHIACMTDNASVAAALLEQGAPTDLLTEGELQTPLHYAARNDAAETIQVLHEHGVALDPRDYKGRTPLLLAAELDRSVAALKLLQFGAKAGIIDKTGQHTVCAMVLKMPGVALKALDQFHLTNRASRQQFFFLNYLEPDPDVDEASFLPMSVIGRIVETGELKLVNHPVIREIIRVKWWKFAKWNVLLNLLIYLVYIISWTLVVVIYQPWKLDSQREEGASNTANKVSVGVAVFLFFYLLFEELRDLYRSETNHFRYKLWRVKQIQRDLEFVPPRLSEERDYLLKQQKEIRESKSQYMKDPWNWFDWLTYILMFFTTVLVVICLTQSADKVLQSWFRDLSLCTSYFMCVTLVFIWIKLFKFVRVFAFLGPFVVILTKIIYDIIKIAFVFVVFYIPTVAVCYQFYNDEDNEGYNGLRQILFTVYRMLLVDDYGYEDISTYSIDEKIKEGTNSYQNVTVQPYTAWTDLVVAYWLFFGAIVVLNLFIALMSDTFQRVYDNAVEVALLEKATIIDCIEENLPAAKKTAFLRFIKVKCAPRQAYYDDDVVDDDEGLELHRYTQQTFDVVKGMAGQFTALSEQLERVGGMQEQLDNQTKQIRELRTMVKQMRRALGAGQFTQSPYHAGHPSTTGHG